MPSRCNIVCSWNPLLNSGLPQSFSFLGGQSDSICVTTSKQGVPFLISAVGVSILLPLPLSACPGAEANGERARGDLERTQAEELPA